MIDSLIRKLYDDLFQLSQPLNQQWELIIRNLLVLVSTDTVRPLNLCIFCLFLGNKLILSFRIIVLPFLSFWSVHVGSVTHFLSIFSLILWKHWIFFNIYKLNSCIRRFVVTCALSMYTGVKIMSTWSKRLMAASSFCRRIDSRET